MPGPYRIRNALGSHEDIKAKGPYTQNKIKNKIWEKKTSFKLKTSQLCTVDKDGHNQSVSNISMTFTAILL